ncbi:MAG: Secreted effector protein PipB2 [Alphaproteobacteria bacterium MarineAlpha3_Bin5]|nr:MAG: Secreted effector protein PipB2 [Alphaproteobacteria bacterium MarineAlpha3_Bin5]
MIPFLAGIQLGMDIVVSSRKIRRVIPVVIILSITIVIPENGLALPSCPFDRDPITSPWSECHGTYAYKNGNKYEGDWKNDQYNGIGTLTDSIGNRYFGQFKNGKFHGYGTAHFANGNTYVGEFKSDKFNGQGTYTFADGRKDIGEWKDDKMHGKIIRYFANGTVGQEGIFENGLLKYFQNVTLQVREITQPTPPKKEFSPNLKKNVQTLIKTKRCPKCNLQGAYLQRIDLSGSDLQGANLTGAFLKYAKLKGANLSNANLQKSEGRSLDLRGCNLQGAKLEKVNFEGANLRDANLRGASLARGNFRYASFQKTNLMHSNLEEGNFRYANFQEANLIESNLQGTSFLDAIFVAATLHIEDREKVESQGAISFWLKQFHLDQRKFVDEPTINIKDLPKCADDNAHDTWTNCVGTQTFSNGCKFVGKFKDGTFHGIGDASCPDGVRIIGEYKKNNLVKGSWLYANGDKYIGEFKDFEHHGAGVYIHAEGTRYDGQFKDGKPFGQFVVSEADGGKYFGPLTGGSGGTIMKAHGKGAMISKNGVIAIGDFKEHKLDGSGILLLKKEKIFSEKEHIGFGRAKYVGEFRNNKPQGSGSLTYPDGNKYIGVFKNFKKHGNGTFFFSKTKKITNGLLRLEAEGTKVFSKAFANEYATILRTGYLKGAWKNNIFVSSASTAKISIDPFGDNQDRR